MAVAQTDGNAADRSMAVERLKSVIVGRETLEEFLDGSDAGVNPDLGIGKPRLETLASTDRRSAQPLLRPSEVLLR